MVGAYVLRARVAEDDRSQRWVARQIGGGRWVEIKFMQPRYRLEREVAGHLVNPYVHEARVAAAARSECIVRHLEVGTTTGGDPFLVRDLVDGITAREAIGRHTRLNLPAAVALVADAASVAEALHDIGVGLGPLPPEKIAVLRRRDGYQGLVLDLDRVVRLGASRPPELASDRVGYALYQAPEDPIGEPLTPAHDMYWLGGLLYELLTGCPPLTDAGSTHEAVRDYLAGDGAIPVKPARQRVESLPHDAELLVRMCMQRDVARRPAGVACGRR